MFLILTNSKSLSLLKWKSENDCHPLLICVLKFLDLEEQLKLFQTLFFLQEYFLKTVMDS